MTDDSGKKNKMFVWNADENINIKKYSVCVAKVGKTGFGYSTSIRDMRTIGR